MDTQSVLTARRPSPTPTFPHVDLALMVWIALGPFGPHGPVDTALSAYLDIGPIGKGMLMAAPILAWSALRLLASMAIDRMKAGQLSTYAALLKDRDARWFMFLYAIGFGSLVGLASILGLHIEADHGLDPKWADHFTAACLFAGLLAQTIGSLLVDRTAGRNWPLGVYLGVAMLLVIAGLGPNDVWMTLALFAIVMFGLSLCNGALVRMLPPRFCDGTCATTALLGMAGGIGGAYIAASLGYSRQITDSHATGFLILAALAMLAATALTSLRTRG